MSWDERVRRIRNSLRMLSKRCLSYRKREWALRDYPIVEWVQTEVPPGSRYWARVLGWNIDGLGATREDALLEMERSYEARKAVRAASGKPIPRPGTSVPIEFASQERV